MSPARLAVVGRSSLTQSERVARDLRDRFRAAGVFVASIASSPGSGKTALLERMLEVLLPVYQIAAIVADPASHRDAARLDRSQALVRQITTRAAAHLDPAMIDRGLTGWDLDDLDFLFIENVGTLVCPVGYDLAEDLRLVLVSVTEGEDKPLKYPVIFAHADAVVVTKIDLADASEFNGDALYANLEQVHPGVPTFEVSAKTGRGMREYLTFLETCRLECTLGALSAME